MFKPDKEYDFPKFYRYWHRCPDGKLTPITIKKKPKPRKIYKTSKKEIINKRMKSLYNYEVKKNIFDSDIDEDEMFF